MKNKKAILIIDLDKLVNGDTFSFNSSVILKVIKVSNKKIKFEVNKL